MPTRVDRAVSAPDAPPEPQRTAVRIGIASPIHATPLMVAARKGLLAQEAIEPVFVDGGLKPLIPRLVAGEFDIAVIDVAILVGERTLGWDGIAIAVFGPHAADRSCGAAVVESSTWSLRRDTCDRVVRATVRAVDLLRAQPDEVPAGSREAGIAEWWADCRPGADELGRALSWRTEPTDGVLIDAMAWLAEEPT